MYRMWRYNCLVWSVICDVWRCSFVMYGGVDGDEWRCNLSCVGDVWRCSLSGFCLGEV